jgi:hypothetical protein
MYQPPHRTESEEKDEPPAEEAGTGVARKALKLALCVGFLVACCSLLIAVDSGIRWVLSLLIAFPVYVCGQWVFREIFSQESGEAISKREFSPVRVLLGVLTILALVGVIILLSLFGRWLLK